MNEERRIIERPDLLLDEEEHIKNAKVRMNTLKTPRELNAVTREIEGTRRMIQSRTQEIARISEAVAEADVATPVLVHVFSRTDASRRVDRALALLAARQARRPGDCRFVGACAPAIVRLDGDTIKSFPAFGLEIDEARLPALLVYRARALVRAEFAADVADADAVEDLLDGCL